jgi:hypothetical protein
MTKETWKKIHKVIKWILFIGWGAAGVYATVTKTEQPWQGMYAISCILLMMHNVP